MARCPRRHKNVHRKRSGRKQTFRRPSQSRPRGTHVVEEQDAQAGDLRRRFKRLTKFLPVLSVQRGLGNGSTHTQEQISTHGDTESFRHGAGHLQALVEPAFPQSGRMERKRNYGLRRQCRGVMLRADFGQQEPQ